MKTFEQKQRYRLRQSKIILIFGSIVLIFSPYILTRSFGFISFENTGQIGDTIGGITAPIANIIGAVLVYYAFLVQLDANNLIFQQIRDEKEEQTINQNRNYVFEIFKQLKDELYSFSIYGEKRMGYSDNDQYALIEYRGLEAINKMLSLMRKDHESRRQDFKLTEFLSIVDLLKKFLKILNDIQLQSLDKKFFVESVEYMYLSKFKVSLDELTKPCENCNKFHYGEPIQLLELKTSIETSIEELKNSYA